MSTTTTISTDQLRRRAARHGYRMWQPRGRHQAEYGPIAMIDVEHNHVGPRGLTAKQAEDLLNRWDAESD